MNKEYLGTRENDDDDWIGTYSGAHIWLKDMSKNDFDIIDIVTSLSKQPRWKGHMKPEHYSVAEHCYHCSYLVPEEHALAALMHDAAEAYLGDMPRPFKRLMPDFERYEKAMLEAIFQRYSIPFPLHKTVKQADNEMLVTEAMILRTPDTWVLDLVQNNDAVWYPEFQFKCWRPKDAAVHFMKRFATLTNKKAA